MTETWVLDTIVPQLSRVAMPGEGWTVSGPVFSNRNGWLFRASHPRIDSDLAIKVQNPALMPQAALPKHFGCLEHYHAAMPAHEGLSVPKPVLLDQANNAIVMHWVAEPQMSRNLLRAGMNAPARRREFERAGRWLAAFHAQAPQRERPLGEDRHLQLAGRIAAAIDPGSIPAWVSNRLEACLAAMDMHHQRLAATPVVFGRRHGDFTPTNLFSSRQRTIGIDFLVDWQGPLVTDICRFMAYADVYKYFLTPARAMDHIAGDRLDLAALLKGYANPGVLPDNEIMTFLQLCETTRRIAARARAMAQHGKTPWRLIELHRLTRRAGHLLDRLNR